MSLFKPLWGKRSNLNSKAKEEGNIYFCKDDGTMHVDFIDDVGELTRFQINAKNSEQLSGASLSAEIINSDFEVPTSNAVATYVDTEISKLVNSVQETLDTLRELEAAMAEIEEITSEDIQALFI